MSDLVGNPEDRFSHNKAHTIVNDIFSDTTEAPASDSATSAASATATEAKDATKTSEEPEKMET